VCCIVAPSDLNVGTGVGQFCRTEAAKDVGSRLSGVFYFLLRELNINGLTSTMLLSCPSLLTYICMVVPLVHVLLDELFKRQCNEVTNHDAICEGTT
jgi:hypothetical protein